MTRLVKKSQQLLSLEEGINYLNQQLQSLSQDLRKLADDTGEDPDTLQQKLISIQKQYQDLAKHKELLLEELRKLRNSEQKKQQIGKHGKMEFYNLILSYQIPRTGQSVIYLKIYEIVHTVAMNPGMEAVHSYVVTLSGVASDSNENYFISKTPLQKMRGVYAFSGEVLSTQVGTQAKRFLKMHITTLRPQSASLDKKFQSFNPKEQSIIEHDINGVLKELGDQYKVQEPTEEANQ